MVTKHDLGGEDSYHEPNFLKLNLELQAFN